MKPLHGQGEIIAGRYQIVTLLDQGGMARTYAAVDLRTHQRVALKVVSLQEAQNWKILERLELEAQVLANLNHPFIPNYLDYFQLDIEVNAAKSDCRFYLVQELVEGESLAALVKQGWHTTEAEVKDIAMQVLEILTYIHQLNPPIIHRDIKPQNIIRRADGKVYLVDFGAVQAVYNQTMGGSKTLVGTFGYMPVEQFQGQVHCASDLYSLGCTLIFLLTHRSPADLPQKQMKIDFRQRLNISDGFATWLERMSEPMLEKRLPSAIEALQQLEQPDLAPTICKPKGTHIKLTKTAQKITIKIPHYHHKRALKIFAKNCTILLLMIVVITLPLAVVITLPLAFVSFSFALIIGFIVFGLLFIQFRELRILLTRKFQLEIEADVFQIDIKEFLNNRHIQGHPQDLQVIDYGDYVCSLHYERQRVEIEPMSNYLTEVEKQWIHQEIINFMKKWDWFSQENIVEWQP
ncbi:MAG: serine/threonine protein kinase [Symploca sp. SIO2E6]|nr:serine/threonine protein kinase [Symploca sp. SIO2E6]